MVAACRPLGIMAKRHTSSLGKRSSQFVAVAERRFDDAVALCRTGENARANGAQYLAGLVIDILLKGKLAESYPTIARKRSHEVSDADRHIWSLVWRSHELDQMLRQMPNVAFAVKKRGEKAGKPYIHWLNGICESWTVLLRYSPMTSTIGEAHEMVERVRELKELLK